MDISEVAKKSGVAASALRYYERKGLIHSLESAGARRQFELAQCPECDSHHLVSKLETRPKGCPFCMLIRRHRVLLPTPATADANPS